MPKTFRLREQLSSNYDTLLGDLKAQDEGVLHRKYVGEDDGDSEDEDDLYDDFKAPVQLPQREPLDLKCRPAEKKKSASAPGELRPVVSASSAFDWAEALDWTRPGAVLQWRQQTEGVEAVSRRLQDARVDDEADEPVTDEDESRCESAAARHDDPIDLSFGAHPLSCFPSLAAPARARLSTPLGSGANPLSPTPGSPYRAGGGTGGGGRGPGGQPGGAGFGPPGFGGLFGPGANGFGFGLMGCKAPHPGGGGERGRYSPRHFPPQQQVGVDNFLGSYIDQQVEGCKPPPQPPPAQPWPAHAAGGAGARLAPMPYAFNADPLGFCDPYEIEAELFGDSKPAVSAAPLADGSHDLFGLEQLLQPTGTAAELSHQTVVEALGDSASLPALSEPVVSSCLADALYDGKFVVTGLHSGLPPPPPPAAQPAQQPESSTGPACRSPGPIRAGRSSPRSPRSVGGDAGADGSVSLDVRVGQLHQRLGLPETHAFEFVNGGHGIKNPHASERALEVEKLPPIICEEDPKTYMCRLCSKKFNLLRLLNRHMKCHSDVKRYLCTFCCKGFNDTFDLKRHTRTHTGVRPYRCMLCEKSFTQRCSLESHCLKVHGVQHQYNYKERRNKMYVCEECGTTSIEPEAHYFHLKERHPNSPALLKFYDKRHFKFNSNFNSMMLQSRS
ncbi:zinc finger protein 628-like [Pollicipes pollicipes]|uniref:zinc finger protein 628-like n=1 Tax=Pollicipes pollicipes TaxID=41117 RepID=UPI0018858192|nr:zinc finger protein 628-like [Pollicipes pollicipes]